MLPLRSSLKRSRSATYRRLRLLCVLIVVLTVVAPCPLTQTTSAAVGRFLNAVTLSLFQQATPPQNISRTPVPERTQVSRVRVVIGETRNVPLAVPMTSVLIVSPEIASAELNGRRLILIGLHVGETILIAFDGQRRHTFLVEVVGRTQATTQQHPRSMGSSNQEQAGVSGSYTVSYSAPFGAGATLFRQNLEFQRKLPQQRTLRFSTDTFKFMGHGNQDGVRAAAPGFGLNYLSLGVDAPSGTLDLLDSQINLSTLSFNNYAMRGFHLVSTPASQLHGVEFFAGVARPALAFFDKNQGRLMGAVLPIAQGQSWQLRGGVFLISPRQDNTLGGRGVIWQVNGRYALHKNIAVEGEVAYANGGFSGRARFDLISKPFNAYGEILRFDRRSPLISIGAQPGARETEAFAFHWQPHPRFNAFFNYYHSAIAPPANAGRATFDRTTLFASANYRLSQNSRLGFRYTRQQIETSGSAGGPHFRFETHSATINHDIRFNRNWANNFELRLNSSSEIRTDAETERGIDLRNQLRFAFKGGSATGFVNYTRRTPSLAGFIVRNPQVLPPLLQRAFAADPVRFMQTNRDALGLLLPGVELPQTRGTDVGLRLQAAFSRLNLASEVRYSVGEILAREQRNVGASVSMNVNLDAANSVQVSGWRSFAFDSTRSQSMLTVSYVHRFGTASGGGFQFWRLLGLDRGQIQGRVFFDQNGNGRDDEDEAGVTGMTVQIDGDQTAITDRSGRFHFKIDAGEHSVAIISSDLGTRLKATTASEQNVSLSGRQTVNVAFGLSNFGSIAGRIFNDLSLTGELTAGNAPGVRDVHISLHSLGRIGAPLTVTVDTSGAYQFRNLAPGSYKLEIDPATLPANFRMPSQSSWLVTVKPLENFYLDIPQVAERAVSGIVFIDKDGNGKFDPENDETIAGARVITGPTEVTTNESGLYLLRGLPAGRVEVRARTPWGPESLPVTLELQAQPVTRRAVNLMVKR
jgi:hypothetical protein